MHNTIMDSRAATPITGVGNGFKSLYQSAMPSQLQMTSLEPVPAKQHMDVYVCSTTADLYKNLGITAAMAVGTSFGSFKTRLDLVNEIQTSSKSVTILIVYNRITGGDSMQGGEFIQSPPNALQLYNQGGDSYVSSISTGGFYIAAFNYATYDETTYQNVKVQANADFSGWSGDLNAQFEANITSLAQNTRTTSTFHQRGEGFTAAMPTNMDAYISFMNNFGSIDLDRPAVLDFSIESYRSISGCPDFSVVQDYMDSWNGSLDINPHTRLASYAEIVLANEQLLNGVQTVYDFYGCTAAEPKLATSQAQNTNILSMIDTWRKTVDRDPTKSGIAVPAISSDDLKYPIAQYTLVTGPLGPLGGGGDWFADIDLSMIGRLVRPTRIAVHSGDDVDKIDTTYAMVLGDNNTNRTVSHGGDGGDTYASINLGPGEITLRAGSLWWWGDNLVKSIDIGTTAQNVRLGRQGSPNVNAIWEKTDTTCIVGFTGNAGRYLNTLGVQYVKFLPCKWESPKTTPKKSPINGFHDDIKSSPVNGFHDGMNPLPMNGNFDGIKPLSVDGLSAPKPVSLDVDMTTILKYLLQRDANKIVELYLEKGGWEGWLQCELAYYIRTSHRSTKMERERGGVYTNNPDWRCDLFMTDKPVDLTKPDTYIVELKAAGAHRTARDTYNGIKDDITKIAQGRYNATLLGNIQGFVFGVLVTTDSQSLFPSYDWGLDSKFTQPTMTALTTSSGGYQIALITWSAKTYSKSRDVVDGMRDVEIK